MATLQNGRQHDLISSGVVLKPGVTEVSDEQLVALGADPQFKTWIGLGWIGVVQYSEDQLRALQAEAAAKEAAAEAERKAAAAKTATSAQQVVKSQREVGLDAELRKAHDRVNKDRAAQGRPSLEDEARMRAMQQAGLPGAMLPQHMPQQQLPLPSASPPGPSKHATLPHDGSTEDTKPPTTGVEGPKGGPLSQQQPGTLEPSKHATMPHDGSAAGTTEGHAGPEGSIKGADVGSQGAQAEARSDVHGKNEQAARDAGAGKHGKK
jgi:hypothetical protein